MLSVIEAEGNLSVYLTVFMRIISFGSINKINFQKVVFLNFLCYTVFPKGKFH